MSIFTLMTIVTEYPSSRCRRIPACWPAAVVLAIGLCAAPSWAAGAAAKKTDTAKATTDSSAKATPEKHKSADGCVLCNGIRLQDEIDVVNTRSICGAGNSDFMRKGLKLESYAICDEVGYRKWWKSDLDAFLAFDPAVPTIIFVHGNQIGPGDAKSEGLSLYRKMILQECNAPKIRFVIFSWPSSKVARLLRDVREKAARTEPAGYHLAWLMDQMPAETPISLIGFSFGARIITGGLHILAGGSLGRSLELAEHVHSHRAPVNAVLMAAASHSYWLAEGQHHGLAMTQVNRMLLINNCADRAMRYYDMLVPGRGGPQALGLCGPTRISPKYADKIFNRDVSRYVGSEHELMNYVCAPGDAGLMWDYAGPKTAAEAKTSAEAKIGG
jgi:hypothetical protein